MLFILLLIGCSSNNDAENNLVGTYDHKEEICKESLISIYDNIPCIFSKNKISIGKKNFIINIEMIKGEYLYDKDNKKNSWSGDFQIRVYEDEYDCLKTTVFCSPIWLYEDEEMSFENGFKLIFDDYNNDGDPDFTLGQYDCSNGNVYAIFSINQKGEVKKIDTGGEMFISDHDYSIRLTKTSPVSFKRKFYDNSKAISEEIIYKWDGDKFVVESDGHKTD